MIQNPTLIGPQLPALTNPGTAADLAQGKELIGADGKVVVGTSTSKEQVDALIDGSITAITSGVATVREYAFINTMITHAEFPNALSIEQLAFSQCRALKSIKALLAVKIKENAFSSCSSLTEVSLPKAERLYSGSISGCTKLEEIHLPKVSLVETRALSNCTALRKVVFQSDVSIGSAAFFESKALQELDFGGTVSIQKDPSYAGSALQTIVLRYNGIATSIDFNAKWWTDLLTLLNANNGYVYVPKSVLPQYDADPNWNVIGSGGLNRLRAIEDYPEITG